MKRDRKKLAKAAQNTRSSEADKQARTAASTPSRAKQPRALTLNLSEDDVKRRRPVWRFAHLDAAFPVEAATLSVDDLQLLHDKLGEYEKQTVGEIWSQHNNGCKAYEVDDALPHIADRIAERELDATALHSLRLTGKYRVWGILREHVFFVVWIDHEHKVWPSKLKHT